MHYGKFKVNALIVFGECNFYSPFARSHICKFDLITEVTTLQKKYDELSIPNEDEIASYYKLRQQLERIGHEMQTFIKSAKYCVPFLQLERIW